MTVEIYQPPADVAADKVSAALDTMTGLPSTWCPGCGHGSLSQILAEVIDELGIQERTILCAGVGCGGIDAGDSQSACGRQSSRPCQ